MIIAPLNPAFKISGRVYVYGRVRMREFPATADALSSRPKRRK